MFCTDCQAESGPTLFCHVCDSYLPAVECGRRGGVARRALAVVLDLVVSVAFFFLLAGAASKAVGGEDGRRLLLYAGMGIAVIASAVAFVWGLSVGQTVGKVFVSLRVVNKRNGQVPGLGRMLLRDTLGKWVSGFFLGLGFFWAIWDKDGQAWHDKIAGTVVVHEEDGVYNLGKAKNSSSAWSAIYLGSLVLLVLLFVLPAPQVPNQQSSPSSVAAIRNDYPAPTVKESVDPSPSATATVAASSATETTPAEVSVVSPEDPDDSAIRTAVVDTLEEWAKAHNANNANAEASFYAEHMEKYFLQTDVSRSDVQNDKQSFLDSGKTLSHFDIGDLVFQQLTPSLAVVRLTKSWVVSKEGEGGATGRITASRITLTRVDSEWKISGEQDLRALP